MKTLFIWLVPMEIALGIWIYLESRKRRGLTAREEALSRARWIRRMRFRGQENGNEKAMSDFEDLARLIKIFKITEREMGCSYEHICLEAFESYARYIRWYEAQIHDSWTFDIDQSDMELCLSTPTANGGTHTGYRNAVDIIKRLVYDRRVFLNVVRRKIADATASAG